MVQTRYQAAAAADKLDGRQALPDAKDMPLNARVDIIRNAIHKEDARLRKTYKLLSHEWQDTVGTCLYFGAMTILAVSTSQWSTGAFPTWALLITNALALSILHELEHDLIHELYFKSTPWLQHVAFFGIWMLKSNAAPWWRKYYHLRHHKFSGNVEDVEERLIGLGMPWNLKRLLVTFTPAATLFIARDVAKDDPDFSIFHLVLANAPIVAPSFLSMVAHGLAASGLAAAYLPAEAMAMLSKILPFLVVYNFSINFPNTLRQFCLVMISTYSHYYGDLPDKDAFYQTQILDHPIFWPMQLFCFNFGATHIIHHFIVRQPFYVRQFTAIKVLPVMKEMGCRHNDLGAQFRSNHWFNSSKRSD